MRSITTPTGGDYVIGFSHLHAGKTIRELPSGYLAFLAQEGSEGGLNPILRVNLRLYLATEEGREKLERGQGVPTHVVVKGFKPRPETAAIN